MNVISLSNQSGNAVQDHCAVINETNEMQSQVDSDNYEDCNYLKILESEAQAEAEPGTHHQEQNYKSSILIDVDAYINNTSSSSKILDNAITRHCSGTTTSSRSSSKTRDTQYMEVIDDAVTLHRSETSSSSSSIIQNGNCVRKVNLW